MNQPDIVDRLRKYSSRCPDGYGLKEAAEEIERLRAAIALSCAEMDGREQAYPCARAMKAEAEIERLRKVLRKVLR
jgi:hypothetical protein